MLLIDGTTAEHARGIAVVVRGILGALAERAPDDVLLVHGPATVAPPEIRSRATPLAASRPGRLLYQRVLLPFAAQRQCAPAERVERILLLDSYAPLVRGSGNTRYAALIHDVLPLSHPEYWPLAKRLVKRSAFSSLRRGDVTLFTSTSFNAQEIERLLGVQARVVPFGCGQLTDAEADAAVARPLPGRRSYLLYVGALEPRKGLPVLLEAFEHVSAGEGAGLQLVIAGGGASSYTRELRARVARSPVSDRIRIALDPGRAEVLELVAHARALLLPSRAEGFGLPLIEAMALGTPVVAGDIPAVRTWADGAALFAPPTTPRAWVEPILAAVAFDEARRRRLQGFASGYRWRICVDSLLSF